MSRIEFMNELRALLQDISEEEREAAMQYYNDYFDDAGAENESSVIAELGSPQKLAVTIKAGLQGQNEKNSEYGETGYRDTRFEGQEPPARRYSAAEQPKGKPWSNGAVKVILIILIVCIGGPIVLPIAAGILAAVFAILLGILALAFALAVGGVATVIGGIVLVCVGLTQLFHSVPLAFALVGMGLLLGVLGFAWTAGIIWLCLKVIPPIFRWIVELCRKPFQKRKVDQP